MDFHFSSFLSYPACVCASFQIESEFTSNNVYSISKNIYKCCFGVFIFIFGGIIDIFER